MHRHRDDAPRADTQRSAAQQGVSRGVIIRDLLIFQVKLFLDGFIDVILAPVAFAAGLIEVVFGGQRRGRLFYAILRLGEKADLWLNLYSASHDMDADGLFGGSKAGSKTLLGELEMQLRGGDEPHRRRKDRR